ncbi:hypothetical protein KCP73_16925 [Salmonella enterica subsp. enterica]|nr:hypothetical protein KCP73_16925 [Salmonella enterica subsp. enterica]
MSRELARLMDINAPRALIASQHDDGPYWTSRCRMQHPIPAVHFMLTAQAIRGSAPFSHALPILSAMRPETSWWH